MARPKLFATGQKSPKGVLTQRINPQKNVFIHYFEFPVCATRHQLYDCVCSEMDMFFDILQIASRDRAAGKLRQRREDGKAQRGFKISSSRLFFFVASLRLRAFALKFFRLRVAWKR
jgi:hypothetical protein